VLGPLLAVVIMWLSHDDFRTVFWLAAIPGLLSVGIIVLFVKEPKRDPGHVETPFHVKDIGQLGKAYWLILAVGLVFTLARFSEAFLLLRAQEVGMATHLVPVILIVMSITYALGAYPAGALSDRWGRSGLLMLGVGMLIATHLVLAFAATVTHVALGAALWGLHLALTQGLFAALVADNCAPQLRGSAFGLFSFASGVAILLASVIAGALWDQFNSQATFFSGAGLACAAMVGGALVLRHLRRYPA